MLAFIQDHHDWLKAFHLMSVMAWMAGLFYLPRLFVYHVETAAVGSEMSETFKVMERKLLRAIMNPAMVSTWLFGGLMLWSLGWDYLLDNHWLQIKLVLITGMTWFHHKLITFRLDFLHDRNIRTGRAYRLWNELPTLLMVFIVALAVVKPF
ncbi:MAG: putative membrane protein [Paracoccaceae bacterium]|jgi:putative membrane protein